LALREAVHSPLLLRHGRAAKLHANDFGLALGRI